MGRYSRILNHIDVRPRLGNEVNKIPLRFCLVLVVVDFRSAVVAMVARVGLEGACSVPSFRPQDNARINHGFCRILVFSGTYVSKQRALSRSNILIPLCGKVSVDNVDESVQDFTIWSLPVYAHSTDTF